MDYSQNETGMSYICFEIGILLIIFPSLLKKKAINLQQIKDTNTRQRKLFFMNIFKANSDLSLKLCFI